MSEIPFTIFVVEDNVFFNKLLIHHLSLNPDYCVKGFHSAKELLKHIEEVPDIVTLDYRLPDMSGSDVLKKIRDFNPNIEVIIISEQNNISTVVDLLKEGAYDYIVKDNDIRERLLSTVNNIRKNLKLKTRISILEKEIQKKYNFQHSIIGNSPAMIKVFQLIEKAIDINLTVAISGETGTGKEIVAKAIHYNSSRKSHPFIAVNVSAIPSELIESELFGHEKGAFTGAYARRTGKFEEASGGTIFLDEIGEMPLFLQAKLLRVLQEREITRIGSNVPVKINCRIIAATHRNLKLEVKNGTFREDLYYRLLGLPIELPALRERGQDLFLLTTYFIENFCKENKLVKKVLSESAKKKLSAYKFPGNIRELKSVIELALVMSNENEIVANDLNISLTETIDEIRDAELTMKEYEYKIVKTYMEKYGNNIKVVAHKLNIGQSTIYRMLKELNQEING